MLLLLEAATGILRTYNVVGKQKRIKNENFCRIHLRRIISRRSILIRGRVLASRFIHAAKKWGKAHVVLLCIAAVASVAAILYMGIFVAPKNVMFSYGATKNCRVLPTVLPDLPRTVTEGSYTVSPEGGWKVGGLWLFATNICVAPTKAPQPGVASVSYAPFGGWLFRQALSVAVPALSVASNKGLDQPIPTTKKLPIILNTPDNTYKYVLVVAQKTAPCTPSPTAARVECDVARLRLEQGMPYDIELQRRFKDEPAEGVLSASIHTLTATTITDGSVKPGETVYARPTELTYMADKPLQKAKVSLKAGAADVAVDTTIEGSKITAKLAAELEREKDYTLIITNLEAADGSTLADPYQVDFRMSGGPKVVGVSVGRSGVAQNAAVTVTFDQALSGSQDVASLASISGAPARIAKGSNTITFSLQGAALCTDFTLALRKGVESSYGIAATAGWSYASRTICHTTAIYGTSVKGRALVAATFGTSGPVTMYVGAIHGNEPSSSGLMKAWIDDLEANPSLYSGKRVVVVPTINPDGLAANTRTNSRGVNLNRNFPTTGWTKDINDTDGVHAGGGGTEPLSEPEAKALADLTISLRPRLLLSYHAVGSLVTGDPGGYSAAYAARYAAMVGYRDATGKSGTFDYDITGAYEDWTYSKQGIPSIVIELGSYGYFDFSYHRAALRSMLN